MKTVTLFLLTVALHLSAIAQTADIFARSLYEPDLIMKFKEGINLSTDQESKMKDIYNKQNKLFAGKKTEWAAKLLEFQDAINARKIDYEEADRLFEEVLAFENDIKALKLNTLISIKNLLTPGQQAQLDQIKETNPQYAKVFELNLGSSESGTKITIRNQQETTPSEQEKAKYFIVGNGIKHPFEFQDLNEIDPADIEAISVFKGESAVKKYGDAGKDGVVEITIKPSELKKYTRRN